MSSVICDNDVIHEQKIYYVEQQANIVELDIANMGNSNFAHMNNM